MLCCTQRLFNLINLIFNLFKIFYSIAKLGPKQINYNYNDYNQAQEIFQNISHQRVQPSNWSDYNNFNASSESTSTESSSVKSYIQKHHYNHHPLCQNVMVAQQYYPQTPTYEQPYQYYPHLSANGQGQDPQLNQSYYNYNLEQSYQYSSLNQPQANHFEEYNRLDIGDELSELNEHKFPYENESAIEIKSPPQPFAHRPPKQHRKKVFNSKVQNKPRDSAGKDQWSLSNY